MFSRLNLTASDSSRKPSDHSVLGVQRSTIQPLSAASLYFSMSRRKPVALVCRPPVHTPPSTSRATRIDGTA